MSIDSELILIYTALGKPSYRRGMFDALSYPNGHVVRYSYRKRNIHESLLKSPCRLEGKRGLVIYVDLDENRDATYFPFRFVTIHRLRTSGGPIASLLDRERIYMPLRLGDYVEYNSEAGKLQWHESVREFDPLRMIKGEKPGKPKYFVVEGRNKFRSPEHSALTAWEDLISALSESHGLRNGVFVKVEHLKALPLSYHEVDKTLVDDSRLTYNLSPASLYQLNFAVYEPSESPETRIEVRTSAPELLAIDQPYQSAVSGLVEKSALIACRRTIEQTSATISITVTSDSSQPSTTVNSPTPILFVRISPPWPVLTGFIVCILIGSFLLSGDSELAKQVFGEEQHLKYLAFGKLLGAVFLAGGAWLGFRRLPALGGGPR